MNDSLISSESIWGQLLQQLLLGNGQQVLSEPLKKYLSDIGIQAEDDRQYLLEGVAYVQLLEKAAEHWVHQDGVYEQSVHFAAARTCSFRTQQHLKSILNGTYAAAFQEFLSLLKQHKFVLPMAEMPNLLNQALKNKQFWKDIRPLIGEKGKWLAEQHPEWKKLLGAAPIQANWQSIKDELKQLQAFKQKRRQQAAQALSELVALWPEMAYKKQAKFLAALRIELSMADEDFLESCLLHTRKEVRLEAANILYKLPDAKLVQRLFGYASSCVALKGASLVIDLPDQPPKATQKEGIYPKGSKYPGGLSLSWLYQMLERIPLVYWQTHWQVDSSKVVRLFAQSTQPSLLNAISQSVARFPDVDAAEALITLWLNTPQKKYWEHKSATKIYAQVSNRFFNKKAIEWLEHYGPFVPAEGMMAQWLVLSPHEWTVPLTKIVILGFQDVVHNRSIQYWQLHHYQQLIEQAAYQSTTAILPDLQYVWRDSRHSWGRWNVAVEKFLQVLKFRVEMQKAFLEPTD